MKLSVVIVSYNVKFYLEQCLDSLYRSLRGVEAEVYVVDNHSKDGSVEYLSQRFPDVRMIASPHNLGFARGNNLAIRQSQAEYVLLLNPDTVVGERTIPQVLSFMDAHPDAGSLGVCMLNTTGTKANESRRGLPSPMVAFYKMAGLCARYPKSRRFGHYYMGYLPWNAPAEIEVVSGAFCLLRKAAVDKVGLLDEEFFMYGEDIDLSYRILKGGYHNYYFPAHILHYKGESTWQSSFRYVHVFYEAMLIFFKKHYSGMSMLLSLPIKTAIYAKAAIELVRMQMRKARQSMGFVSDTWMAPLFIFLGSQKMVEACERLAERKGLLAESIVIDFKESVSSKCANGSKNLGDLKSLGNSKRLAGLEGLLPDFEHDSQVCQYLVFDCDMFTYDEIFEFCSSHPNDRRKMAFYHSSTGKLVTENEIFF